MNIVIVDDEPLARERLRRMVTAMPGYDVAGEAADGASALTCVRDVEPDVVLLDIHMPGTDGLQVAARLAELPVPPAVIFVTAHVEHALAAHNMSAAGYLLKPISHSALADALSNARRPSRAQLQALEARRDEASTGYVAARTHDGQSRVAVGHIIYFWADQKYTTVCHLHGELLIEAPLSNLEERFGDAFMRVHRKALVARRYIIGVQVDNHGQARLVLRHCRNPLPVSRRRLAEVRQLLSNGFRQT